MKSSWLLLGLLGLISSVAIAADSPRDRYIAEIVSGMGIEDMLAQTQKDGQARAQIMVDRMLVQMKDVLSRVSEAKQQQFREAVGQFMATACQPIDGAEAAAEWGRLFAADLTDDELRAIAENFHNSRGNKELKAATNAATQWAKYLQDRRAAQVDKATAQYVADLKAIIAAPPQAGAASNPVPSKDSPAPK